MKWHMILSICHCGALLFFLSFFLCLHSAYGRRMIMLLIPRYLELPWLSKMLLSHFIPEPIQLRTRASLLHLGIQVAPGGQYYEDHANLFFTK